MEPTDQFLSPKFRDQLAPHINCGVTQFGFFDRDTGGQVYDLFALARFMEAHFFIPADDAETELEKIFQPPKGS